MSIKYSEIVAQTQRRAQKVTTARGLFILNKLVKKDIYQAVMKTFPDYFEETMEVTMIDGTLSYALPTDFYATKNIEDESGNTLFNGANSPTDSKPKNNIRIYGGNLIVSDDRSFKTVLIRYYKKFPDFDDTSEIDLPDEIADALDTIWVTGLEFFHFSDNKKTQETEVSFSRYKDAKNQVLTYSIGSLR